MSSITPRPGMTVEISMQGIEKSRLDAIESAEALRKADEAERAKAEVMRKEGEAGRITAEAARANAEALRHQTFETNEANRHTAFESAENARESEWVEIKHGMEISIRTAVADAEDAAKNANSAAESANAAAEKSVRYDEAQTLSDAQKAQARGNIDAADAESVDALNKDLADKEPLHKVLSATLVTGETMLTITDDAITDNAMIYIYTNVWGVQPYSVEQSGNTLTLTFDAQSADLGVKVEVR